MDNILGPDREKELVWYSVLESLGFDGLRQTPEDLDRNNAVDVAGYDKDGYICFFGTRLRDEHRYPRDLVRQYKHDFGMTYGLASGKPAEWQKVFEQNNFIAPNYLCHGWLRDGAITDYVVVDVAVLMGYYREGLLEEFRKGVVMNKVTHRSSFVIMPLQALRAMPQGDSIIYAHSENHPAFVGQEAEHAG